jgi:transposase
MEHISGVDRNQTVLLPESLEDYIHEEHPVRVIDAYIESLDLEKLGFKRVHTSHTGRRPYHPGDLLKLYLYGYNNRTRSSRELEKRTHRNIEVMWLLRKLTPDFKTIADFRKDNGSAIRHVMKEFTLFCQHLGLIKGELLAIDGSKFKAVNSKDRNLNKKKLNDKLRHIDKRIDKYLEQLDANDEQSEDAMSTDKQKIQNALEHLKKNKSQAERHLEQLEQSGEKQLSLTDEDARSMHSRSEGYVVAYNVQTAVDAEHKLIVAVDVSNEGNDRNQLYSMAKQSKELLGCDSLEVLADSGYSNEDEVAKCLKDKIIPSLPKQRSNVNDKRGLYSKERFEYNEEEDCYRCPQGQTLTYRSTSKHHNRQVKLYRSEACKNCQLKSQCTTNKKGREIARGMNEGALEEAHQRFTDSPVFKIIRKSTVEHPFGTIKRIRYQGNFLMKRLKNVKTEISLSALAYNLARVIKIKGSKELIAAIEAYQTA